MKLLLTLVLAATITSSASSASASDRWNHDSMDVSLVVPNGWRISQHGHSLKLLQIEALNPDQPPGLDLSWEEGIPDTAGRKSLLVDILTRNGYAIDEIVTNQLKVSNWPSDSFRAKVRYGAHKHRVHFIIVPVDGDKGYSIWSQASDAEDATVEPDLDAIIGSLHLGKKLKK